MLAIKDISCINEILSCFLFILDVTSGRILARDYCSMNLCNQGQHYAQHLLTRLGL